MCIGSYKSCKLFCSVFKVIFLSYSLKTLLRWCYKNLITNVKLNWTYTRRGEFLFHVGLSGDGWCWQFSNWFGTKQHTVWLQIVWTGSVQFFSSMKRKFISPCWLGLKLRPPRREVNWTVIALFQLIWHQTRFCLVADWAEKLVAFQLDGKVKL